MSRYAPVRQGPRVPRVDREKTCPSLLRVFVNPLHHHQDSAFSVERVPAQQEYQVYVWRDSTLREILLSLRDAAPHLRSNSAAKYSLKLVFWDSKLDRYASTDLALVHAKDLGAAPTSDQHRRGDRGPSSTVDKTLGEAKYVVGDFIDVAYIVPGVSNSVGGGPNPSHAPANGPQFAPIRSAPGGGRFGAPRVGGAGGGAPGAGRRPAPADQGWGNRRSRPGAAEDRGTSYGNRPPRRNSRSRSPERRPARPRSRTYSPEPKDAAVRPRERSTSPKDRRATPPHMKGRPEQDDRDDERMKD